MENENLLTFALKLAHIAEKQILPLYNNCVIKLKSDGSEVTEADKRAEHAITQEIIKQFPNHSILGEEFGTTNDPKNQYQWIIDPLDGTTWFAFGVPIFGTLIALLKNGDPIIGVIHFPITRETVYASKGMGCWFKKDNLIPNKIEVDSNVDVESMIVSASGVHNSDITILDKQTAIDLSAVINKANKFRFCGDCLQHALLCRGKIHVAIDTIMQPWDTAAIIPCVGEAGGIATNLKGDRDNIIFGGNLLTSSNQLLHDEILKLMKSNKL